MAILGLEVEQQLEQVKQTFLAGLDEGSTVIVSNCFFTSNPDDDNTNLDFALNLTTNPTTQGYGTTNFSITREQALICNTRVLTKTM